MRDAESQKKESSALDPDCSSEAFLDALEDRIDGWPVPLAYAGARCLECADEAAPLVSWLFKLYGQVLRLSSLFLIGVYFRNELALTDLNTAVSEGLRRPALGHWRSFLRDVLARIPDEMRDLELVQAINRFHRQVGLKREVPGPPMIREGRVVRGQTNVLDAVLQVRNQVEHGALGLDSKFAEELLGDLGEMMIRVVKAFDSLSGVQLVAETSSGSRILLHGPELPGAGEEDHHCMVVLPDGEEYSLFPLALLDLMGEVALGPDAPPVDLLLFDGRVKKRLTFLGLESKQERGDVYPEFSRLLEQKKISADFGDPVPSWDRPRLVEMLALRQFQLEEDGTATSPPEVMMRRQGLEDRVSEFLASPFPALLLTGEPGAGRSAFLAGLTRNLLSEGVAAFNIPADVIARDAGSENLDNALAGVMRLRGTFNDVVDSANRPAPSDGPALVIMIDSGEAVGLPEKISGLVSGVERLAGRLRPSHVKFIVALQSPAFARILDQGTTLDQSIWFHSVSTAEDGEQVSCPEVVVEKLTTREAELLYSTLRERAGQEGPETPWNLLPEEVRERVRVPAFARRLVDYAKGQAIRGDGMIAALEQTWIEGRLFGRRYDSRRKKYVDRYVERRRIIADIAKQVLSREHLTVALADLQMDDESYGELLRSGIIREVFIGEDGEEIGVCFSTPAAFSVAITGVLAGNKALLEKCLDRPDLDALVKMMPGLEVALGKVLSDQSTLEIPLSKWLRLDGESPATHLKLAARALLELSALRGREHAESKLRELEAETSAAVFESILNLALDVPVFLEKPEAAADLASATAASCSIGTSKTLLRLSRVLRRTGRMDEAERVLQMDPHDDNTDAAARRLYLLGSLLRDQGKWKEALPVLENACRMYREFQDCDGVVLAQASRAEALSLLGEHDEAAAELESTEEEIDNVSLEVELRFLMKHVMSLRMRGMLKKAWHRCKDVLHRATSASLLHLAGRAHTEMGIIHSLLGDGVGSLPHLQEALSIKRQLGDVRGMKQAFLCLGFAHETSGEKEEARSAYEQSLRLNEESGDRYGQLLCLGFLNRLDTERLGKGRIVSALLLARDLETWQNPRIDALIREFEKEIESREPSNSESDPDRTP